MFNNVADGSTAWKNLGEQLDGDLAAANRDVERQFFLVRIAAVYLLKDRTAERWTAFQAASAALTPLIDRWAGEAGKSTDRSAVVDRVREYIGTGARVYELYGQQAALDTALVDTGRSVIDNAAKLENDLEGEMNRAAAFAILLMLVSAACAIALGAATAILLTRAITGAVPRRSRSHSSCRRAISARPSK